MIQPKLHMYNVEGPILITPQIFEDRRGYFFCPYIEEIYNTFLNYRFVQENESCSLKGTIRGLHFQKEPHAQGKLVCVVRGSVNDFAVDIRKGSPTYSMYIMAELSAENKQQLWIPPGFAHGFEALEDNTILQYKCTDYYNKKAERGIIYDDPDINIPWETKDPILSDKDKTYQKLRNMDMYFEYKPKD